MSTTTAITLPTVHLNGTSRDALKDAYQEAFDKVHYAIDAVEDAAPNARDYYVNRDPNAFTKAVAEHTARLVALKRVEDELEALYRSVQED